MVEELEFAKWCAKWRLKIVQWYRKRFGIGMAVLVKLRTRC